MDSYEESIKSVARYWGNRMPMMAVEEAGEFIQAISKVERRKDGAIGNLVDEIGDLRIALDALMYHYAIDPAAIADRIASKLNKKY